MSGVAAHFEQSDLTAESMIAASYPEASAWVNYDYHRAAQGAWQLSNQLGNILMTALWRTTPPVLPERTAVGP